MKNEIEFLNTKTYLLRIAIAFAVFSIGPWSELIYMAVWDKNAQIRFQVFIIYVIVAVIAIFFALAKRSESRVALGFFGLGYLIASFGFAFTEHPIKILLGGAGVALITGSLCNLFIRAFVKHRQLKLKGKYNTALLIANSIAASITALILLVCGNLVLIGFFLFAFAPLFIQDVISITWGIVLLILLCVCIAFFVILRGVISQAELIVYFWGKWISPFLPGKKMLIATAFVVIPLGLPFACFTNMGSICILIMLAAMISDAIVIIVICTCS
jgi:hypothetical protein